MKRVPPLLLRRNSHKQWQIISRDDSSDSDTHTSVSPSPERQLTYTCGQCQESFTSLPALAAHRMNCRPDFSQLHASPIQQEGAGVRRYLHQHGLNRTAYVIRFAPDDDNPFMQPDDFFNAAMPYLSETHERLLNDCRESRVHFVIQVRMVQIDVEGEVSQRDIARISIPAVALTDYDMDAVIHEILVKLENFIRNGSNWLIEGVDWFDFCITRYHSVPHVRGHGGHCELPARLKNKHAVVNVDNDASDCFKYAVLSVLHYDEVKWNKSRPSQYTPWLDSLHWEGIQFPMTAGQIKRFERNNPGLRINLLKWDDDEKKHPVRCLYHTAGVVKENERILNILAVDRPHEKSDAHFVGVVHLDRLLNTTNLTRMNKHCERCLQPFSSKERLATHRKCCYLKMQETLVPAEASTHRFTNWANIQRLPYVVYADIECLLTRGGTNDSHQVEKHVPAAFAFLLVHNTQMNQAPLPNRYQEFVGEHCIEEGLAALEKVSREVYHWNFQFTHEKVVMSRENQRAYNSAQTCFMCGEGFITRDPHKKKVIEHDHLNGVFRGAACQDCNMKAKLKRAYLPVFFHNLRNYDMHALCASGLGKLKHWNLSIIPQTEERYMALKAQYVVNTYKDKKTQEDKRVYMTLRFLDSFQFMAASLDSLVRNLNVSELKHCATLQLPSTDLITSKGVFPYSYFNSFERLRETCLPPREAFQSSLTGEDISPEEYARAEEAWEQLKCRHFGDYMSAYLKRDVYQLADIFEHFRSITLREDGLDPVYYTTLPGLTWDSAFKKTGAEVDLLTDVEMYEFVERSIRGGMTFINDHYLSVNTPRVPETYQADKPVKDLLYVDVNNLYGHSLSQRLPQSNFHWLSEEDIQCLDLVNFNFEGDEGLLLEVDLDYPVSLQDTTEDLPFAPELCVVDPEMLTKHMKTQWARLMSFRYANPSKPYKGCGKLLLTHYNRENYVVHGQLLQFYLRQGMILTKIHRVLAFKQAHFFKPYIAYNSLKRQQATTAFEKDYYKLKNNALFGKTMENVRRRMNFRLCNTEEKLTTLASRPEFLSSNIFNEDLVGVRLCKQRVVLNKPIFIGQAVLDLSKLEMYTLRYVHLKRYEELFGGKIRAAGGDTDSLFLRVQGIHVERDLLPAMLQDELLDTSNYPSSHPLYSTACKAKLGCIKDESEGVPFLEWVLLRPKNYSMKAVTGLEKKRAKGVRRFTLAKEIRHADFLRAYREQIDFKHKQRRIGSLKHQNFTLEFNKRSLTFFEDKRAWIGKNRSLPYGNHRITEVRRPPKRKQSTLAPECLEPERKHPKTD